MVIEPLPDLQQVSSYNEAAKESQVDVEIGGSVEKSNVTFTDSIGHGWFGWVVTGILVNYGRIIVKRLREDATPQEIDMFRTEHMAWKSVSHDNVIKIIGSCFNSFPMLSLMEWSEHISAKTYLLSLQQRQEQADINLSLQLSMDACAGLAALHSRNITVSDLAVRNCVLNHNFVLKICDYGLGRAMFASDYWPLMNDSVPPPLRSPLRWSSPKQLSLPAHRSIPTYSAPSIQDNLWSLAVVIWELLTFCKKPYHDLSDKAVMELLLSKESVTDHFKAERNSSIKQKCVFLLASLNFSRDQVTRFCKREIQSK